MSQLHNKGSGKHYDKEHLTLLMHFSKLAHHTLDSLNFPLLPVEEEILIMAEGCTAHSPGDAHRYPRYG